MGLEQYRRKRDFKLTPEPSGEEGVAKGDRMYVIQKHAARHLHYDFRLELGGTLKSWAIPKGPSLDPKQTRLAVHVEDHPIAYGDFEGVIPARQYGAGTVMLWDRGHWLPEGDPDEGYRKGRLVFWLEDGRLRGKWALVRMAARTDERGDNWLLIKEMDEHARTGPDSDITLRYRASISSQRDMDGIALGRKAEPARGQNDRPSTSAERTPVSRETPEALPDFIPPQLATLVERAPSGSGWLTEIKYDGYRILARLERGKVQLWSRNRQDWTKRMASVTEALGDLGVASAWLDGEVVALDAHGAISFQALQSAFPKDGVAGKPADLRYMVFDLLWLDGEDLRPLPLRERKARLTALLKDLPAGSPVHYSEHLEAAPTEVFHHACLHAQEGIMLKQADAPYVAERSQSWLKLKCSLRQEFVIGGYTDPKGSRHGFGALLLGLYREGRLEYAGRVGTGFDTKLLSSLAKRFKQLRQDACPFDVAPDAAEAAGAHWISPELVAEVRFAGWTEAHRLRQAAFVGLREDKPAEAVGLELPTAPPVSIAKRKPPQAQSDRVAGVTISHPDRVLFADIGLSKIDVARYYEAVADQLLPQLHDRPLSLMRCPRGPAHQCFFQKHLHGDAPAGIARVEIEEQHGSGEYMIANTAEAVVGLVQMGVLELHTWGARRDRLDRPDRLILDLDPAPDVAWAKVAEAAQLTRALLEELGLPAFLKTTGGKGLHIEVPLLRQHDWQAVRQFSQRLAQHLAKHVPDRFVANMSKAKRVGRIFVDYLRNGEGATAVAAFSLRARPGATVAVPISWDELAEGITSDHFTVASVPARLASLREDPWAGYESARVRLTREMEGRLAS